MFQPLITDFLSILTLLLLFVMTCYDLYFSPADFHVIFTGGLFWAIHQFYKFMFIPNFLLHRC